jgi:DNA recombination protein RmuC
MGPHGNVSHETICDYLALLSLYTQLVHMVETMFVNKISRYANLTSSTREFRTTYQHSLDQNKRIAERAINMVRFAGTTVNETLCMEIFLALCGVLAIAGIIYLATLLAKMSEKMAVLEAKNNDQLLTMMNQNLQGVQERIDNTTKTMNERLDNAARVIGTVSKEIGSLQSIGQGIKSFQEFLNSPKLRGNLGEQVLNESLKQHFPADMYEIQHKFKDGNTVDAVIKTGDGLIPVDSKFPMEAFRRMKDAETAEQSKEHLRDFAQSVKKHINDIAKKYILTSEGTLDFAVMYVPSEHIYYEIVTESEDLMTIAQEKRVLVVSPNSLTHFLRVILMGIERNKLQEGAKKIWELLKAVQTESVKFGEQLSVVSRHVTNAKNAMDTLNTDYNRFASQIDRVKLIE